MKLENLKNVNQELKWKGSIARKTFGKIMKK